MVSEEDNYSDKYLEAQVEEIEVLCSIYGDEWKTENESDRSYSMEIKESNLSVTLNVTLPRNYPFDSPPTFTLSAPGMKRENKKHLSDLLEEVYLQNIGQTVLFQWIDKIKDYLASVVQDPENLTDAPELEQSPAETCEPVGFIPDIVHGEPISDRKSTFQGHVACVVSLKEVSDVLNELKKNRKIANATHNMFAYRIKRTDNTILQDFDDDGETHGGGRLLHLLHVCMDAFITTLRNKKVLNVSNVMVVVSRWYGGIQLKSARFTHINNAARQALEQAGIISSKKT